MARRTHGTRLAALVMAALSSLLTGCVASPAAPRAPTLGELRKDAPAGTDPETAGNWLLAEMLSPGGDAARAVKARARLDALGGKGPRASLARGLDDALHGRLSDAAEHYFEATSAARDSGDPLAPLIAWFSANRGVSLAHDAPSLWDKYRPFVLDAIESPRGLGWRARGELVEWAIDHAFANGEGDLDRKATKLYGCASEARFAGPFGRGRAADATRAFAPEKPGAWPYRWEPEPDVARAPTVLAAESHSCALEAKEKPGEGIYYVETFFETPRESDVLLAVQGALAVLVDDRLVLSRDVREWGVWPRFGVTVRLAAGRHRVVARLGDSATSIRLMRPDGTPLGVPTSASAAPGYVTTTPRVLPRTNVLDGFVRDGTVLDPKDDVTRALGAFIAHVESSDDIASVLVEPLLGKGDDAAGPALALSALFAEGDPIFEAAQANDLVREFHERAVKKDPKLWASRLALALSVAEKKGAEEAVPLLETLSKEFPGAPEVALALARLYGELDWAAERSRTILDLAARFPTDIAVLHAAVEVLDARGDGKHVDELVERIQKLDRDDDIAFARALERNDYAAAIRELERFQKLHPEQEDLEDRIRDAKIRAGDSTLVLKSLEEAVKRAPTNANARLDLADARRAENQEHALEQAIADSVQAGANPAVLNSAVDLVSGVTAFEPYRLDARAIIAAYEKSGRAMPGTAARILDYAALWVRGDGSSRMLEHEIIRIQSAEAISTFAEHRALEGTVLHMRVIKKDGTTLEPEIVQGKPTVTFPHLEVGDYIETEQIVSTPSEGRGELEYLGPRWFFREENVGYARSEFVVIAPENRSLVLETTGKVPAPVVEKKDGLVTYRYRVDESPAAPSEPGSVPVTEFLPSVRIGWGVTRERRLSALSDALTDVTPVDPRVRRIAAEVAKGVPASDVVGRARKLYRWLLDNVEPGDETDGRRIVIGKRGNLWRGFRMLCRSLGIPVKYAVARSRLAAPPVGPISESTLFTQPVANVGSAWFTLGNKYAPFGYLPVEVRGMPAYFVEPDDGRQTTLPDAGGADGVSFSGRGTLDAGGGLSIDLVEEFSGKLAIGLRRGLSQVGDHELRDVLESNLLAQTLRGGSLLGFGIDRRDDVDAPLGIRMKVRVSRFAEKSGKALVVSPPLAPDLARMATLPARETPLLIGETMHRTISVDIELPPGAKATAPPPVTVEDGARKVVVADSVKGNVLHLSRTIEIPAGRVQPADYPTFARFAQQADDALSRTIRIEVP
ncbi:MAG TPA: DUF3857 domain-containing protein [Polyangiaceae bacterium]|nr:DUF3857 domain-containing protein [Polyangiaceae bacterium]